jgi:hypothetical protein
MKDILLNLSRYVDTFAVVVTLLATVATLLRKVLEKWFFQEVAQKQRVSVEESRDQAIQGITSAGTNVKKDRQTRDGASASHALARSHVIIRLEDASVARAKEQSSANVSRILSGSLTFAQVVIGGV